MGDGEASGFGAHAARHTGGVVVCMVDVARCPFDGEFFLFSAVFNPPVSQIHGSELFLFDGSC